jgi:peptidoglycan/LPS O-acetylase OafA/YrhL
VIETTDSAGVRTLGHVPALDGLRGIAVLLVIVSHTPYLIRFPGSTPGVRGGWLGVDIFFVLSGFLITALLLGEYHRAGRVGFGAFYARRGLRLLPALWFLLAAQVVYYLIAGGPGSEWKTVTWAVLYVANWHAAWDPLSFNPQIGHLWSLAIEEQFYLVWPWVLVALVSLKRPRLGAAIIAATIGAVVLYRRDFYEHSPSWPTLLGRTDTRADSLLVGCLLAWAWTYGFIRRRMRTTAWIALFAVGVCVEFGRVNQSFWYNGGFTMLAVLVAIVVLGIVEGEWSGARLLSTRPLVLIGRVSYGLYLWHHPVFWAIARHAPTWPPIVRLILGVLLTAGATAVSWKVVEQPAQRLRRRFGRAPITESHRRVDTGRAAELE